MSCTTQHGTLVSREVAGTSCGLTRAQGQRSTEAGKEELCKAQRLAAHGRMAGFVQPLQTHLGSAFADQVELLWQEAVLHNGSHAVRVVGGEWACPSLWAQEACAMSVPGLDFTENLGMSG